MVGYPGKYLYSMMFSHARMVSPIGLAGNRGIEGIGKVGSSRCALLRPETISMTSREKLVELDR